MSHMDATNTRKIPALRAALCLGLIALLSLPSPVFAGTKHGIDVSHHQGRIRWGRVAKAGVDFAFIKATEGVGVRDPRYRENRKRAKASNIKVGAYHFARPSGAKKQRVRDDARLEARYFLNVAQPKKNELAPVLDLETSGVLNRAQLKRWTKAWLQHVYRKSGTRAIVYAGPVFWQDRMSGTKEFAAKHPLWVAHYTRHRPIVPAGAWAGEGWTFWQYTDCGKIRGVRGCVDRNRFAGDSLNDLLLDPARVKTNKQSKEVGKTNKPRRARASSGRNKAKPKVSRRSARDKHPKRTRKHKKVNEPRPKRLHSQKRRPARKKPGQIGSRGRRKPERSATSKMTASLAIQVRGPRRPLDGHPKRVWTRRV